MNFTILILITLLYNDAFSLATFSSSSSAIPTNSCSSITISRFLGLSLYFAIVFLLSPSRAWCNFFTIARREECEVGDLAMRRGLRGSLRMTRRLGAALAAAVAIAGVGDGSADNGVGASGGIE